MGSFELRWGLIIGLANLIWLYGSYYLGMHTSGLAGIQIMGLISVIISILGYTLALRSLLGKEPETTTIEGIKSGVIVAGVVAAIAIVAQVGYFKVVHPGFTDYMVEQTRLHFTEQGLPGEQIEQIVEQSRNTFALKSYAAQAAMGALVIGTVASTIVMLILRRRKRA